MVDKLREFLKSPEGKKSIEEYHRKEKINEERIERWSMKVIRLIKNMSESELHDLFTRFLDWEKNHEDMFYNRGILTSSNIFGIIINVLKTVGDEFESDDDFYSDGWTYRGYIFKCYCGQGCFWRVIYKNEIIFQTN